MGPTIPAASNQTSERFHESVFRVITKVCPDLTDLTGVLDGEARTYLFF